MAMFKKPELEQLKNDFEDQWRGSSEYEDLVRDLHLGIAYHDAGQSMKNIDPRAVALIEKHAPADD